MIYGGPGSLSHDFKIWAITLDRFYCIISSQYKCTYMHTSVCVLVKHTTQMSTVTSLICLGPSFQKMTHNFLLHESIQPTSLEKNLKP